MIPPVILASQSPRRRELLEKTGIPFSIIVRGTEELKEASMPPQELCLHNASGKPPLTLAGSLRPNLTAPAPGGLSIAMNED